MAYPVPYHRQTAWYERKALRQILISSAQDAIVYDVATNSPAAAAGLRQGDKILSINGEKIYSPVAVIEASESMTNAPPKALTLAVERGGNKLDVSVTPEKPLRPTEAKPSLGIVSWQGITNVTLSHPSPGEQIDTSLGQIVATLRTIFSKKSEVGVQQLGGAVMIIRVYKNLFENEDGWRLVLWFSVVMNVNLALLNMLPFPVLDGGHITLALLELVRRRPVSAKVLQYLQTACAVALIAFMLFLAFFDTGEWVRSARKDRDEPIVFAPKN
jgi:regulator of sigma E protease